MPLPTIEYHGEDVTITHSSYGVEDHGILTCTVVCEWGGNGQGFGNLCLDERTGPAFVRDLCAFFGVEARPGEEHAALAALSGQHVRALWYRHSSAMEGFERDGRRFLLREWRRRMFPNVEVLDPRANQIVCLRSEIASLKRRISGLHTELTKAVDAAYDWPAARAAADDLLKAADEWWNGPIDGSDRRAIWTAVCRAHVAAHEKDDLDAREQAEKLRGLTSGIEPLRGPLERLCAELGV